MPLIKLFSREYSVQYTEACLRFFGNEVKLYIPALINSMCFIPEEKNEACYAEKSEWDNFIRMIEEEYGSFPALKKLIANFHKYGKRYVSASKKIYSLNLKKLSNKDLARLLKEYTNMLLIYSAYLSVCYFLNDIYANKGKDILAKKQISANIKDSVMQSLYSPSKKTGILLLQDKFSRLKEKNKSLNENLIKRLSKTYAWISCLDLQNDTWTEKEILEFYTHSSKQQKRLSFEKASKIASLTPTEASFFKSIRELAYVKDMRDVYRRQGVYYIYKLFDQIASRFDFKRKDIAYMTNEEIIFGLASSKLSNKKKITQEIAARKKGFFIYWQNNLIRVESSQEKIDEFKKDALQITNLKNEVHGTVASRGHAKGRVKIVYGIKDLSKVQKGDILIAITTHPDFVPAMHKAAAIVTNEGGLTSHAAIVSRELGVPCIVNTKVATQFFKDGDLVDVDAEKGIIRKV